MENIIFLDIDGVLNSYHFCYNLWQKILNRVFHSKGKLRSSSIKMISKPRLLLLSILCKLKNCKIVMSSSWRYNWNKDLVPDEIVKDVDDLFKRYGLNLVGKTDTLNCKLKKEYKMAENIDTISSYSKDYYRGTQILKYIEDHNLDINNCIIIDDDIVDIECYDILKPRMITTCFYKGLGGFLPKHLFKALKLLKRG